MSINTGKFIVIDGTDGSGKATQTLLLVEKLKEQGFMVEIADFPQYNTKSAGLIEEYLSGKYGEADEVDPYRASIFYACDRYDASSKIKNWLKQGKIVISNRYVTANMGHQGGKIKNQLERKRFFNWLYQLEYEIFNIPKPDLNIILYVPAKISQQLAQQRQKEDWVGKTNDIHQNNFSHLKKAEQVYLEIAKAFSDFVLIECVKNGVMMNRREINEAIWREVIKIISPLPYSPDFKTLHEQEIIKQTKFFSDLDKINIASSEKLKLKIEKISPLAKLPSQAYGFDAGLDLYSADYYTLMPGENAIIKTGIKMSIPTGFAGLIWDKGGMAKSGIHTMAGVIDAGFRGEITVNLINLSHDIYNIAPGQKIAQLLIQKVENLKIEETKLMDETARGQGRFGSSGIF